MRLALTMLEYTLASNTTRSLGFCSSWDIMQNIKPQEWSVWIDRNKTRSAKKEDMWADPLASWNLHFAMNISLASAGRFPHMGTTLHCSKKLQPNRFKNKEMRSLALLLPNLVGVKQKRLLWEMGLFYINRFRLFLRLWFVSWAPPLFWNAADRRTPCLPITKSSSPWRSRLEVLSFLYIFGISTRLEARLICREKQNVNWQDRDGLARLETRCLIRKHTLAWAWRWGAWFTHFCGHSSRGSPLFILPGHFPLVASNLSVVM